MSKFDLQTEIENYECPSMLKVGMIHYFTANNIKVTSKKEFDKAVKDYLNLNIGE